MVRNPQSTRAGAVSPAGDEVAYEHEQRVHLIRLGESEGAPLHSPSGTEPRWLAADIPLPHSPDGQELEAYDFDYDPPAFCLLALPDGEAGRVRAFPAAADSVVLVRGDGAGATADRTSAVRAGGFPESTRNLDPVAIPRQPTRLAEIRASKAAMVWDGNSYAVASCESEGIRFVRVSRTGELPTPIQELVDCPSCSCSEVAIAAGSDGFGVAWKGSNHNRLGVHFHRIDYDGVEQGVPLFIEQPAAQVRQPWVVWDGQAYTIAWTKCSGGCKSVQSLRVSADGAVANQKIRLTDTERVGATHLIQAGTDLVLVWVDEDGAVRFVRHGQDRR